MNLRFRINSDSDTNRCAIAVVAGESIPMHEATRETPALSTIATSASSSSSVDVSTKEEEEEEWLELPEDFRPSKMDVIVG